CKLIFAITQIFQSTAPFVLVVATHRRAVTEGEHDLAVLNHCGFNRQPCLLRRFERCLQCRPPLASGFLFWLAHGVPRRLIYLPAVRPRLRWILLLVRSALTGSRRSCAAESAVWNARSRIDKFVTRARGGNPLGSSGRIDIHIAM